MADRRTGAHQPWRHIAHAVLPPAATVLLSVAILAGAIWVRQKEQAARLESSATASLGSIGSPGVPSSGTGSDKGQSLTPPHVTTGNTTQASSGKQTKTGPAGSNKVSSGNHSRSKTGQNTTKPAEPKPPTSISDVGFLPVTGGTIAKIATGQRPSGAAEASSLVSEFGTHPDTTWSQTTVPGPNGVSLTLPTGTAPSSYLVLPLQSGVLWAQIPATQVSPTGRLGPANTATNLSYTPFPSKGTQVITKNAQLLGRIPATVTGIASDLTEPTTTSATFALAIPPATWYAPTTSGQGTANGNQTANNAAASGGTANTTAQTGSNSTAGSTSGTSSTASAPQTANTTSNSTSGTTTGTSSTGTSSSGASGSSTSGTANTSGVTSSETTLYLSGLYQTAGGAIIALQANSSSATNATATWLYAWKEATGQLTPIAALTNGDGTFSWFAPGTNKLFFGIRSVILPQRTHFRGHQFEYDPATLKLTPIRLGTWTSSAYTSGGELIFDVRNSTSWESFTPTGKP